MLMTENSLSSSKQIFALVACSLLAGCIREVPPAKPTASPPSLEPQVLVVAERVGESPEARSFEIGAVEATGALLPPLPRAVTSFGAASTKSEFFVVGGYFGTPHAYSKEGQSTEVLRLDLANPTGWERIATLDEGLQGLAAVHHDGRLCAFGGSHASNAAGEGTVMVSTGSARCLDLEKRIWTRLPDLPEGRSSHGAAIVDGVVYVVGGWVLAGDPTKGRFAEKGFSLDLTDPSAAWREFDVPFSRRALGVEALGTRLVALGGMTKDGSLSKAVDIFDPKTKAWSKGADFDGDAFGVAIAAQGETVYASGRDGTLRSLRWGDAEWKSVRRLAFDRFFHAMRPFGDRLILVGGIGGMHTRGRTRVVESVLVQEGPSYGQLTFSTPTHAKNREGLLAEGEHLYFFGGNLSLGQHDFAPENFSAEGWALDLATLRFTEAAPFPVARQSMQVLKTESGALALGGFGHEPQVPGASEAVTQREIYEYSHESEAWSLRGRLPRGRTQFGVAEGAGKIWIFGGLNYDPARKDAFDHDLEVWVSEPNPVEFKDAGVRLPGPRRAFAGATLGDVYYLIGGMKEGFELVTECLSFDLRTKSFAQIACPEARLSGDLIALGDKLYLVGGSKKTAAGLEESRTVEVYDPKANAWSKLDFEIPVSTRHLRALPFHGQILLITTHFEANEMTIGFLSPR